MAIRNRVRKPFVDVCWREVDKCLLIIQFKKFLEYNEENMVRKLIFG